MYLQRTQVRLLAPVWWLTNIFNWGSEACLLTSEGISHSLVVHTYARKTFIDTNLKFFNEIILVFFNKVTQKRGKEFEDGKGSCASPDNTLPFLL